jgi:pyruvate/2-oxoglutarate/acetoin dehydrogenase E1 component
MEPHAIKQGNKYNKIELISCKVRNWCTLVMDRASMTRFRRTNVITTVRKTTKVIIIASAFKCSSSCKCKPQFEKVSESTS